MWGYTHQWGTKALYICFQTFFEDIRCEITEKGLKWTNQVENGWKKVVQPALGCAQLPKAGWNTQQTVTFTPLGSNDLDYPHNYRVTTLCSTQILLLWRIFSLKFGLTVFVWYKIILLTKIDEKLSRLLVQLDKYAND